MNEEKFIQSLFELMNELGKCERRIVERAKEYFIEVTREPLERLSSDIIIKVGPGELVNVYKKGERIPFTQYTDEMMKIFHYYGDIRLLLGHSFEMELRGGKILSSKKEEKK